MSEQIDQAFAQKSIKFPPPKIWILFQVGVLIFPIIPSFGGVLIFITIILRWIKYNKINQKSLLNKILAVLSIWLIITSCFATYAQEAFLGLANYLPFFFAFSSLYLLFNHPSQLRQIAWLMVIPSFFVVILGLGQLFLNWHIPYLLDWELVTGGVPKGRMSSVFLYANFLAIYLQITFILALGLWVEIYQNLIQKKSLFSNLNHPNYPFIFPEKFNNFYQNQIFIFLNVTLILDIIGLILTSSRNSWLISFIAVICFLFDRGLYQIILGLISMILTIIWSAIGADPVKTWLRKIIPMYIWGRLSDEMYPDRPVEMLRITQWKFTINLIQEHPFTGWGLRNFTPLYEQTSNLWLGHPHNFYLMFTAETGIIGITLLGIFIGIIIYQNLLLLKQLTSKHQDYLIIFTYLIAFASCMLFNCFDVSLFDLRVNVLTWILLFALGGLATVKEKTLI